jgi:TRAP-type C4-dicarboxylate transport system permease small subunit
MRDNQHLIIDSILSRIPVFAQRIIYFLVQASVIWLMFILARGSWLLMLQNLKDRWVATHFPTYLVYASGLITGIAIGIIALANMFRLVVMKMPVADLLKIRDSDADQMQESIQ